MGAWRVSEGVIAFAEHPMSAEVEMQPFGVLPLVYES